MQRALASRFFAGLPSHGFRSTPLILTRKQLIVAQAAFGWQSSSRGVASGLMTGAAATGGATSRSAPPQDPWRSLQVGALMMVAYESTRRSLGVPLLPPSDAAKAQTALDVSRAADAFWHAPFAIVLCNRQQMPFRASQGSPEHHHDLNGSAARQPGGSSGSVSTAQEGGFELLCDRPFVYANKAALAALGGSWEASVDLGAVSQLPANTQRLAPPPPLTATYQQQQAAAAAAAASSSASKSRDLTPAAFRVLHNVRWHRATAAAGSAAGGCVTVPQLLCIPVFAPNDALLGTAFVFDTWVDAGAGGATGRAGAPPALPGDLPTEASLQAAGEAVRQQADAVRRLKVEQGLGNKEPLVLQAVAQLNDLKQALAAMQAAADAAAAPDYVKSLMQRRENALAAAQSESNAAGASVGP